MAYVLGVDIGTQSTKALLIDAGSGRIAAQFSKSYQPDTPRPLWAEQHAAVWLDASEEWVAGYSRAARVAYFTELERVAAVVEPWIAAQQPPDVSC